MCRCRFTHTLHWRIYGMVLLLQVLESDSFYNLVQQIPNPEWNLVLVSQNAHADAAPFLLLPPSPPFAHPSCRHPHSRCSGCLLLYSVFTPRTTPPTATCNPTCRWEGSTAASQFAFHIEGGSFAVRKRWAALQKRAKFPDGFSEFTHGMRRCAAHGERLWMWRQRKARWWFEQAAVWAYRWAVGWIYSACCCRLASIKVVNKNPAEEEEVVI